MAGVKLKMFAALLLRAMAREQAENGTERVSPRDPNVARRLGLEPDSPELATAERYLLREDYIRSCAPADHKGNHFTITETGWEELGYQQSAGEWRRMPWWRRMLGVQGPSIAQEGRRSGCPRDRTQGRTVQDLAKLRAHRGHGSGG